MSARPVGSTGLRLLAGLAFAFAGLVVGGSLGLVVVRLFVPRGGTGWDDLGNALGGLFLGGLLGFVVAAFLIPQLPVRRQLGAAVVSIMVAAAAILLLVAIRPDRTPIPGAAATPASATPPRPTMPKPPPDNPPESPP